MSLLGTNHGLLAPWRGRTHDWDRLLGAARDWTPTADLHETEDAYTIEAELPGLTKDDVHIEIEDNVITLRGERKHEKETTEKGFRHIERRYGHFTRSFEVVNGFDGDKVAATLDNGILHVTLPKREEAKPKKIEVNVS